MALIAPAPNLPDRVFASDLLRGKTALVTGASGCIGRAVAAALADAGADLLLAARRPELVEEVAAPIRERSGRRVEVGAVDIRSRDSVEALAAQAARLFARIDILVNNAGGQFAQPARDYKPKGWNAVIETNLTGTWNMTQVFGVPMLDGEGGAIVNVIAVVGRGFPGIAHTGAARAGVAELSRSLAYEWVPKVRVNCVAPGFIDTDMTRDLTAEQRTALVGQIPLARLGSVEDVAAAVTFLASPAAAYITGATLHVNGGMYM